MAEFRVVLDGLELSDEQNAEVSQAVLTAAFQAVGRLRPAREEAELGRTGFMFPVNAKLLGPGIINGGKILRGLRALELQKELFANGPLAGELGEFRA